jgi:Flp pilus assembly CpaF family ATPase
MTTPNAATAGPNGPAGESAAVEAVRQEVGERLAAIRAGAPLDARVRTALTHSVGGQLPQDIASAVLDPRFHAALVDVLVVQALDGQARQALRGGWKPLTPEADQHVARAVRNTFLGLGGLQPLLDDPDNETININGCDNVWVHRRDGTRIQVGPVADSDEELIELLRAAGARGAHERRFDIGEPELSMQLPGGQRLFALQAVTDRVCASIRLHPLTRVSLDDQMRRGQMTPGLRDLLTAIVRARFNLVVSGGPAAGKTTLLRTLIQAIPRLERIITVEDSYELALDKRDHPNSFAMQSREANIEGAGQYDLARAVRASLRMTPDRVIVGEVRGAEVVQMAKAMSVGIDGSMATVHASSSRQALLRMVTYAMEPPALYPRQAATALIADAVDFVLHLDRARDGVRVVSSLREITDTDGEQIISNEVYRPGPDKRALPATQLCTDTIDRLVEVGFDPANLNDDR